MSPLKFTAAAILAISFALPACAATPTLCVAVAADFVNTIDQLSSAFQKTHPIDIKVSVGASGSLYQQIHAGAPYDIFFSADQTYAEQLVRDHTATAQNVRPYAQGILVLWSNNTPLDCKNLSAILTDAPDHIVLANPSLAPYGKAAVMTLKSLQLWSIVQPKLVFANDVGQAFGFIETHAARLAFVSQASVIAYQHQHPEEIDYTCVIPQHLYSPLIQSAALLNKSANNPLAKAFFDFVYSQAGEKIIESSGYHTPAQQEFSLLLVPVIPAKAGIQYSSHAPGFQLSLE